jgi:tetratricopeptide (TPR) repeat protein
MVRRTARPPTAPPQPDSPRAEADPVPRSGGMRKPRRLLLGGVVAALLVSGILCWRPAHALYVRSQAEAALLDRDGERALSVLTPALSIAPRNAEFHFLAARAQRRRGDLQQAREHLQRAWELGHPVDQLQREQWLAMAQAGQLREAAPHLAGLLMNAGENGWEVCEAYAAGYILACRFDEAQQILEAWKRDFPDDAQPHYFEGRWLDSARATARAVTAYREAMRRDPQREDVRRHLAACLVKLHQYDEATALLGSLLEDTPTDADLLNDWATCLLEQGDADRAGPAVVKALQSNPEHVGARLTRARIASFSGDYEAAVEILAPLAAERPYDVEARYAWAMALQAVGRQEEAAGEFAFAAEGREALSQVQGWLDRLRKEPRNAELRFRIGAVLSRYHSPSEGADWLRSVLDVDPQHREALEVLVEYHRSVGHHELADTYARQLQAVAAAEPAEGLEP